LWTERKNIEALAEAQGRFRGWQRLVSRQAEMLQEMKKVVADAGQKTA
jgi:hypothetical protein